MSRIDLQGIELSYEDRGAGKPAFVFLHGWTCNRSFFAPQIDYFSRRHRVVSIDLRGHGESDKPQGLYPISAFADDTAYVIEKLNLGKAIAVGHSMGAITALQMAAFHSDFVSAIVMVDPAPFVRPPELLETMEQIVAAIRAGNQKPRQQYIMDSMFLPTSDRKLIEDVLEVMMAAPVHVAAEAMRGILDFDAPVVAAQCKTPVLHLAATPPRNPPHLMSEWLPTVVNGWTVGAGHFNQLEAPDQVNAMIESFLRHYV